MPTPEMIPVSASNVSMLGYDAQEQHVYVQFHHGGLYVYKGISEQEFENLRAAPSIGSYLNRNFKNVYPYERIG